MKKELKNTKMKNNKGFSLVELIVVIAIMAVLMAVLAPAMLRYVEKSRVQKDETAVSEVINAVNNALADEAVNDTAKAGDTLVITTGAYTPAPTASGTSLVNEVAKTIPASKLKLVSKTHKDQKYTITLEAGADGALQADEYNATKWTDK